MTTKKDNYTKRRKYFINKTFQAKFIIKFCFLIVLACILFGGLIYFMSLKTTTTAFENSRLVIKSTADYLLPILALISLITIIIVGVATMIITLFISHKIAGPAYRFEKISRAIAGGDLSLNVKLRSNDQLQPVAEGMDEMIKSLRLQIVNVKERLLELTVRLSEVKASKGEKIEAQLVDLNKILDELNKDLKHFKL